MKEKRIGIYVRVSTQDQSTELQRREILDYLSAKGWEYEAIYEDKATGTRGDREMLQQMMMDAASGKIKTIVVWKLDRLFRSLKGLILTLHELNDLGVEFISIKDNLDFSTSSGKLMGHIIGAFAEFEVAMIRERIRSGLANARAKGKVFGRPKKRNDTQIHALKMQGYSVRRIARELGLSVGSVQSSLAMLKAYQLPPETK